MNVIHLEDRLNLIHKILIEEGQAKVNDLALKFNVTPETIRRDLTRLESKKLLKKIHGGAINIQSKFELGFVARQNESLEEKNKIAIKAATLIQPGDTLFIDFGTTTLAFAKELAKINNLTITTNSPTISSIINENKTNSVILIGGQFINNHHECLGSITLANIANFFADYAIIGTGAVDIEKGFMNQNIEEAAVARKMIAHSKKTIVLADAKKMGKQAISRVATWDNVNYLVTNFSDDQWILNAQKNGTEWILAY